VKIRKNLKKIITFHTKSKESYLRDFIKTDMKLKTLLDMSASCQRILENQLYFGVPVWQDIPHLQSRNYFNATVISKPKQNICMAAAHYQLKKEPVAVAITLGRRLKMAN
jgi:hypothetical protein